MLECGKHNAELYGVGDRISWYEGDCFEILRDQLADLQEHSVVFASPPWGGVPRCFQVIGRWLADRQTQVRAIDRTRFSIFHGCSLTRCQILSCLFGRTLRTLYCICLDRPTLGSWQRKFNEVKRWTSRTTAWRVRARYTSL